MDASMMQQQIRLGFRQAGSIAGVNASANTSVLAFANEPTAAIPPARYPLANFCTVSTVAASAAAGTSYKFTRKGVYEMHAIMPGVNGLTTGLLIAISLDCPAAQLLVAGVTPTTALTTMEDYDVMDGVAAATFAVKARCLLNITNPLRGSLPLVANGTAPGTARIHVTNGAGAIVGSTDTTDADIAMWCNQIAELFG
jgi:hypothetical protein